MIVSHTYKCSRPLLETCIWEQCAIHAIERCSEDRCGATSFLSNDDLHLKRKLSSERKKKNRGEEEKVTLIFASSCAAVTPGFLLNISEWSQRVIFPEKIPAAAFLLMLNVSVATPGMLTSKHT